MIIGKNNELIIGRLPVIFSIGGQCALVPRLPIQRNGRCDIDLLEILPRPLQGTHPLVDSGRGNLAMTYWFFPTFDEAGMS